MDPKSIREKQFVGLGAAVATLLTVLTLVLAPAGFGIAKDAQTGDLHSARSADTQLPVNDDYRFRPVHAGIGTSATCPPDLNGNGDVDFADILVIIGAWGPCAGCPEDLNNNGQVDFADILVVIGAWGPCPS
ncbi:MAG: hypothetical protein GY715_10050 [Planctomycetes bacterium]|nr:hypothetical protein [Planctomycetota bacterium]